MISQRYGVSFLQLLMMAVLSIMFMTATADAQPANCTSEMSHYWKMDEAGSPYDDFYGTIDGDCISCPLATTGIINGAQDFNGTDNEVDVPDDNTYDWGNTDSFSIEFWMKPDISSTCSGNQVVVGRNDGTLHWWAGCLDGGKAYFNLVDNNSVDVSVMGSTVLTDGKWHHIVAVRDSGSDVIRLYVDGTQETFEPAVYTGDFVSFADLNIGYLNFNSVPGFHFDGTVDEVALYNRTLNATEIEQHYYDGIAGLALGYCACDSQIPIMPLGDSITHGLTDGIADDDYIVGYRQQLYLDLTGNNYNVNFTGGQSSGDLATPDFDADHEGVDGRTVSATAAGVYTWLENNRDINIPFEVVLLHIGTNSTPSDAIGVEEVLNEIDRYETDYGHVVTVVLARILEKGPPWASVTPFNDDVQTMAEARITSGDRIIIVDMESALVYPNDYYDPLHPTPSGYDKMKDVWLTAVETFLPVCSTDLQIISEAVIETGLDVAFFYDVDTVSGQSVTYDLLTGPSGMFIDQDTGLIEWTAFDANDTSVSVQAVNGGSDTQDFTVNVLQYPSDMIHYWKLDESGGSEYHDFYGSNNARCSLCPAAIAGKVDGGIDNGGITSGYGAQLFDGNSERVNVSDDDTFDWTGFESFSIEFWMKTASSSTCSGNQVIVGRSDGASSLFWWVGCVSNGGKAYFELVDTGGSGSGLTGTTDLTDGGWHHIVAVRDAGLNENRLYVDGTQEGLQPISYSQGFDSTVDLNIGYLLFSGTPGFHFDGTVDEVALYNRALTTDEISQHFNNGSSGDGYGTQIIYEPEINVSDSILPGNDLQMDFGPITELQSSAPATVTISNTGLIDLIISDIAITGTDNTEFELDVFGGTCASTSPVISSGSNCSVTVTFNPTSVGAKSANLGIDSDDSDEPTVTVALSGTGQMPFTPEIDVTDSILPDDDLQMQFVDTQELMSSDPETVTISNTGTADLSVSSIQLSGTDNGEFELDVFGGTCGGISPLISAGSNCTVKVTFSPTSGGAKSADLEISSDDSDEPTVTIALSGTGLIQPVPEINVADSILPNDDLQMDFGQITESQSSTPATVAISNTGTADLNISGIQLAGNDPGEFELDVNGGANPCGSGPTIIANDSCTVQVTFSPTSGGAKSAVLEIASDDGDEPTVTVALSGTGLIQLAPEIDVTDSILPGNDLQIPFVNTKVNVSSDPQTVTISNTGTSDLSVSGIQLAGADTGEFELNLNGGASACGITSPVISAAGNCTVQITFSPASGGTKSANLGISSNDSDESTVTVALTGTGVTNNPPTPAALVYPTDGLADLGTTIPFSWNRSTDPDPGDTVSYEVKVCEDQNFTQGCITETVTASLANKGVYFAGTGYGLVLFGFVLLGTERGRKNLVLLLVVVMLSSTLLVACGGGGGGGDDGPTSGDITQQVSGLNPGTTYYWKVVTDDSKGGTTDSEIRSFTTQ